MLDQNTNPEVIGTELTLRISERLASARSEWRNCVVRYSVVYPEPKPAAPKWSWLLNRKAPTEPEPPPELRIEIHYPANMPFAENVFSYIPPIVKKLRQEFQHRGIIEVFCVDHPSPNTSEVNHGANAAD